MNTQAMSASGATTYAWNKLKLTNATDYPAAICLNQSNRLFAAAWNTTSGYLASWSPSQKWTNLGGSFKNPINQMCADKQGNIYLVGDQNLAGNYVIRVYNAVSKSWSEIDNSYKFPINFICCDSNNNLYITGNFVNLRQNFCVMQYNISSKTWTDISGSAFTGALQDLCIDSNGTLYALTSTGSISYYSGGSWNTVSASQATNVSAICCDDEGNVYFNTSSSIGMYNTASQAFTDLNATLPTYSGTDFFFLYHIDGILYFSGYGYTSTSTTSAFVHVYEDGQWTDITPSGLNATGNNPVLYGTTGYTGLSHNILLASNQNYVYDGKLLISE